MLTLDELKEYYEKGFINLRIDFTPDLKFRKVGIDRVSLTSDQIRELLSEKKVSIIKQQRKFGSDVTDDLTFDVTKEGSLAVSIERGHVERGPWEKIKKQMREAGFSYRSESPWFCVYKKGKWVGWPFC